jgi:hypothetical protein
VGMFLRASARAAATPPMPLPPITNRSIRSRQIVSIMRMMLTNARPASTAPNRGGASFQEGIGGSDLMYSARHR